MLAFERTTARQHLVEQHTQSPEVRASVDLLASYLLGLLVMLPIAVIFLFDIVSDGYFAPLTHSAAGFGVIGAAALFWVLSLLLARKVLSVDL